MQRLIVIFLVSGLISCSGGPDNNKSESAPRTADLETVSENGVGPIDELKLPDTIDQDLAKKGKNVFEAKCTACHKTDKKYIGPNPTGILERRNPAWVMNMIMNPDGMVKEDPVAKALLIEYNGTPMANQNLSEEEARAILEYFRTL
ncbi:c-type cytochrome [Balneola sp. MJW-20]|uniref:c-type cytochrome n=1 Tax=Gracilimonas aurantiaca TaxID=3234185 RepID=UPI0034670573